MLHSPFRYSAMPRSPSSDAEEARRLQQVATRGDEQLEEAGREPPLLPLLVGDRPRVTAVGGEDLFETRADAAIVDDDVDLFVHRERAVVQIGAAHSRPDAIDDDGLGVQQGGAVLVHLNAGLQQRSPRGAARLADAFVIDRPRPEHLDAAPALQAVEYRV